MDDEDEKSPESLNTPQTRSLKVCNFSSLHLNSFHIMYIYIHLVENVIFIYVFLLYKFVSSLSNSFSIWAYFIDLDFDIKKAFVMSCMLQAEYAKFPCNTKSVFLCM